MRRPARIALAAAVVPVALLGLAACTTPAPLPTVRTSASPTPSASAAPSVAAIAGLARKAVGSGVVASVEDESAGTVWDVEVVLDDGEVRQLHLSTAGKVLAGPSSSPTSADEQSANRAQVAAASVSLTAAVERMRAAVPGGTVTAIGLAQYEDRVVWAGDVTNTKGVRQDVRIDAVNGAVLLDLTDGQTSSGGS